MPVFSGTDKPRTDQSQTGQVEARRPRSHGLTSSHRKIELQSPDDLTYLIGNVRRAAEDSINAAFPPVEGATGQDDELRTRIEQLVYEYINQTFTLAAPNLSINGLPVEPALFLSSSTDSSSTSAKNTASYGSRQRDPPPQEQYEPFDGRKRERVEVLAREEEDLLREIASLKRRVPGAAAAARADALREAVRADEEAAERMRAETAAASGKTGIEIGLLERQAAVEASFAAAVATLERLKRDMPATVAKMERARVAGEYVVTER